MKAKSCKDIERKVPRPLMQKGIEKCKENIIDYLLDAKLISKTGRLHHAIISLEFALEEFGKILLLKETMNNDKKDPVEINGKEFCSHNGKVERALKVLDPSRKFRVMFSGYFLRNYFAGFFPLGYGGETVIGDKLRLDCAFVDFVNNDWTIGCVINQDYFQELVNLIEQELLNV